MGRGLPLPERINRFFDVADAEQPFFATLRAGPIAERLAFPLACTLAAVGVWLRCRALTVPFWLDEAAWTERLLNDPLRDLIIRPIGFMLVERTLARTFGVWEIVLRFVPWL